MLSTAPRRWGGAVRVLALFTVIALAGVAVLPSCSSQQREDIAGVGADIHELKQQFDRADQLVAEHCGALPAEDCERLTSEWQRVTTVVNYVQDTDPVTIARHPEQFASQYITARSAYSNIRDLVEPHLNTLPPEDRRFVERLDATAIDLDQRARRLMGEGEDRERLEVLVELLKIAAGLSRALPAVL